MPLEFWRADVEGKLAARARRRAIAVADVALDDGPKEQLDAAARVLGNSRDGAEWTDAWLAFRRDALREEARESIGESSGRRSAHCWAELTADIDKLAAVGDHEQARDLCLRIAALAEQLAAYHDRKAGRSR